MKENNVCPDCELYELHTTKEFENNRCEKCSKRYRASTIMRTSRGLQPYPYIKIKDIKDSKEYVDFYNNYIQKCNKTITTKKEQVQSKDKNTVQKRNRIPTELSKKIKSFLKEVTEASDQFTSKQLYLLVTSKFPDYTTSYESFIKFVSSNKFPHLTIYGAQPDTTLNTVIPSTVTDTYVDTTDLGEIHKKRLLVIQKEDKDIQTNKEQKFDNECEKLKTDIQNILTRKYQKLGCPLEMKYSIEELIKTFEILQDLKQNCNAYITQLSKQHYATDGLQNDILHEIENEDPIPGDNTLQIKLHILRDIRRDLEFGSQYMTNIKPFMDNLSCGLGPIQNVIKGLKNSKRLRQNPIYIPRVDMSIPDRYDWGVQPSSVNNICNTNEILRCEINPNQCCYEFSCELSGGGYGVYKPFKRRYLVPTPEEAVKQGKKDVNEYIKGRKGVLVSNIRTLKIN